MTTYNQKFVPKITVIGQLCSSYSQKCMTYFWDRVFKPSWCHSSSEEMNEDRVYLCTIYNFTYFLSKIHITHWSSYN